MGRFQGVAENMVAEAMVHGWEAICKLWSASGILDNYGSEGALLDDADKTVQKNLQDALGHLEAALEKFGCNSVRYVSGITYDPVLHELDPFDPKLKAFRQRREYPGSSSGGAALSDSLNGAAVALVVRPGLEVSGILRARPRVRVSLPSTLVGSAPLVTLSASSTQQQNAMPAPSDLTAPQLGAAAPEPTGACTDAVTPLGDASTVATSAGLAHAGQGLPDAATAASVSSLGSAGPVSRPSEQVGSTDDSEGWHEWSPASGSGRGQESDPAAAHDHRRADVGGSSASTSVVAGGGGVAVTAAAPGGGGVAAAAPRGPLQLLLALRAGHNSSGALRDASEHSAGGGGDGAFGGAARGAAGAEAAAMRPGWPGESSAGRWHEAKGASTRPDPAAAAGALRSEPCAFDAARESGGGASGDGNGAEYGTMLEDDGDDDVCYLQYDASVLHPVGNYAQQRPAPASSSAPPPPPQQRLQQQCQPVMRVAVPLDGGNAGGIPPSAASAVPVLLALERAATLGPSASRGPLLQGPNLHPSETQHAGRVAACSSAAATHAPAEAAGVVAAICSGSASGRSQGAGEPDGGNDDSDRASAAANTGRSTPSRASGAYSGVAAAAAKAAAAAFKSAAAKAAAEASRLGVPSGRSTPLPPSSTGATAAAAGVAPAAAAASKAAAAAASHSDDSRDATRRSNGAASAAPDAAAAPLHPQPNGCYGGDGPEGAATQERPPRQSAAPINTQQQQRQQLLPRKQRRHISRDSSMSHASGASGAGVAEDGPEQQWPAERRQPRGSKQGAVPAQPQQPQPPQPSQKREPREPGQSQERQELHQQPQQHQRQQQQQQPSQNDQDCGPHQANQREQYGRHPRKSAPEPPAQQQLPAEAEAATGPKYTGWACPAKAPMTEELSEASSSLAGGASGRSRNMRSMDGDGGEHQEDGALEYEEPGGGAEGGRRRGGGGRGRGGGGRRGGRGHTSKSS
ncbi:hypothetical protein PLESTM_000243900 [Pleodorina starrii]|nr:hypothetical protein PLESTM_000243900 [Pleodorina starrii]